MPIAVAEHAAINNWRTLATPREATAELIAIPLKEKASPVGTGEAILMP
jgi:hypothetical protein